MCLPLNPSTTWAWHVAFLAQECKAVKDWVSLGAQIEEWKVQTKTMKSGDRPALHTGSVSGGAIQSCPSLAEERAGRAQGRVPGRSSDTDKGQGQAVPAGASPTWHQTRGLCQGWGYLQPG